MGPRAGVPVTHRELDESKGPRIKGRLCDSVLYSLGIKYECKGKTIDTLAQTRVFPWLELKRAG